MKNERDNCPVEVKHIINNLLSEIVVITRENFIGCYVHGSLAMGGFNPKHSDIDLLVITNKTLQLHAKRKLASVLLYHSTSPYPIEISFLNINQLINWQHPSPFDFHYSEFWRERYEMDLLMQTSNYINESLKTDPDLAAHITVINHRGRCIKGKPIEEVFPTVSQRDYISSIIGDYYECLENIEYSPIYCTLNLVRVFLYLKEGVISSKQEAGNWAVNTFPNDMTRTLQKVVNDYASEIGQSHFDKNELTIIKDYIDNRVQKLLIH